MPTYHPRPTEEKWQKRWLDAKLYETDLGDTKRKKYYNLVMFPYPSGDKLHIGHWYNFAPADSWGRYMRMKGYNVFEPQGYDSFGLPAENYAIKHGIHPTISIAKNIEHMRVQLREMGAMYDFSKEVVTSDPVYYKWTQWIFLKLYEKGLAYRKKAPVNWCPSCQTVLANEQVVDGCCERCKSEVTKKDLTQWFFKIRDYAQRLLNFEGLDWPEKTKLMQQHWIGRSEGSEIYFPLKANYNYVLLHGYKGGADKDFFPWLQRELEAQGHKVQVPNLPNPVKPEEKAQVDFVLKNVKFDENTIIFGHSLGSVVALKVIEALKTKVAGVVFAGGFMRDLFPAQDLPFHDTFDWKFDLKNIRSKVGFIKILSDVQDKIVPLKEARFLQENLGGELLEVEAATPHFNSATEEPEILKNLFIRFKAFTTTIDTVYGVTFVVISPEHPDLQLVVTEEQRKAVQQYIEDAKKKTDIERSSTDKEKTGVFSGSYLINPLNGQEIPLWIADYVLMTYGTGVVMGVPAHDQRDMDFAKKYKLPIVQSIISETGETFVYDDVDKYKIQGKLVDSGSFTGMAILEARQKITQFLNKEGLGNFKIDYKLRDWLISRQRYWGAPIPIVFCEKCGDVPVPEKDLPVVLPLDVDFTPKGDGKSPLNTVASFVETTCPRCGEKARREIDTMDTFVDSSWYFLRYPTAQLTDKAFDEKITKQWLPVDMYIGGPEHACMHLLYARFINMVLYDLGLIDFAEPFKKLVHQGMITKDGAKMSKSKGNVVSPDQFVEKYGSDVFRMYLMFMGPFTEGGDWNDQGITGIARFVEKFYVLMTGTSEVKDEDALKKILHKTIKKITEDMEKFQFNTAVAAFMEFVNAAQKTGIDEKSKMAMTRLIAPLAPHLAEEIWEDLGQKFSVFNDTWPSYDETFTVDTLLVLPIQVNGKLRGQIQVDANAAQEEILASARVESNVVKYLDGKKIQKEIYVPGRLVSFVVEQ